VCRAGGAEPALEAELGWFLSAPLDSGEAGPYLHPLNLPSKESFPLRVSPALVGDLNRTAVLSLIARQGPISRSEVARRLAISPATVTSATRNLLERGLINVVERAPSRGGRPALLLGLVASAAHALGVKIAADHIVGVRVDLDGEVLHEFECPFDAAATDALDRLTAILKPHVTPPSADGPLLLGIGLGVPGVADGGPTGPVTSPVLGWKGLAIAEFLERDLAVPVLIDNDVNTLAVAERLYGRGQLTEHFLTVTIGRGVGLGIVVGGDVYRGANGGAGEFGHVTAVEDGPLCECGKHGCLEALVADPALVREARAASVLAQEDGIDHLRALADAGDEGACAIYRAAGATFGRAVANLVNVLSPECVFVSGEGTQAWAHLAPSFRSAFEESLFAPFRKTPVEIDPWDDARWAIGAAALVLRATFVPALSRLEQDESVRVRLAGGETQARAGAVA
jgi:predicted NBD/HSP70 family sugar kinase